MTKVRKKQWIEKEDECIKNKFMSFFEIREELFKTQSYEIMQKNEVGGDTRPTHDGELAPKRLERTQQSQVEPVGVADAHYERFVGAVKSMLFLRREVALNCGGGQRSTILWLHESKSLECSCMICTLIPRITSMATNMAQCERQTQLCLQQKVQAAARHPNIGSWLCGAKTYISSIFDRQKIAHA